LKNSLAELPLKMRRVRMPYKRFSPISDTFLVTPFGSVSDKSSFSTATGDYTQNHSVMSEIAMLRQQSAFGEP
jgi:hypothetical protein